MKVASEGLKALGNLAKSKIAKSEDNVEKSKESTEAFKNDALDLATGNRATYSKIANEVEDRVWNS
ncbi:MAG: hypothetical protein IJH12_06235 [Clostridia bacterium]|nr:hypothetical protein [Clostridia bacterium]